MLLKKRPVTRAHAPLSCLPHFSWPRIRLYAQPKGASGTTKVGSACAFRERGSAKCNEAKNRNQQTEASGKSPLPNKPLQPTACRSLARR